MPSKGLFLVRRVYVLLYCSGGKLGYPSHLKKQVAAEVLRTAKSDKRNTMTLCLTRWLTPRWKDGLGLNRVKGEGAWLWCERERCKVVGDDVVGSIG